MINEKKKNINNNNISNTGHSDESVGFGELSVYHSFTRKKMYRHASYATKENEPAPRNRIDDIIFRLLILFYSVPVRKFLHE